MLTSICFVVAIGALTLVNYSQDRQLRELNYRVGELERRVVWAKHSWPRGSGDEPMWASK